MSGVGRRPPRRSGARASGRRRTRAPAVVVGRRSVTEAIVAGRVLEVRIAASARSSLGLRSVVEAAAEAGIAVREVPRAELDSLASDHHGVVAFVTASSRDELGERELATWPFDPDALVVVLDGLNDPQNLGAAARSSEAAGAAMLVSRTRRAAAVTPAAIGASAGALLHLPHARVANVARAIGRLHEAAFTVVGLDDAAPLTIYDEPCPAGRTAVVVGSEGSGMSRLVREACDVLVSIPMEGRVGSLNAAASLTAALYAYVLPSRLGATPNAGGEGADRAPSKGASSAD